MSTKEIIEQLRGTKVTYDLPFIMGVSTGDLWVMTVPHTTTIGEKKEETK